MNTCGVSFDLRRYLNEVDRSYRDAERQLARKEKLADEMMSPGETWYPYCPQMMFEAISECDQSAFDKFHMLTKLLEKSEYEAAGAVLNSVLQDYCKSGALMEIERKGLV